MQVTHTLTSVEIQEIGEALYGRVWQGAMARALGVPRQSVVYYLKAGGVNRTQASAIIGLLARTVLREAELARISMAQSHARQTALTTILARLDRDHPVLATERAGS